MDEIETADLRKLCQQLQAELTAKNQELAYLRTQLRAAWLDVAKLANKLRDASLLDAPAELNHVSPPLEARALPGMDSNPPGSVL